MAKIQEFAAGFCHRQTGRCHVGLAPREVRNNFGNVVNGFDNEVDAQGIGEALDEVKLGPCRALRTHKIRSRGIASDDTKFAKFKNLVQR